MAMNDRQEQQGLMDQIERNDDYEMESQDFAGGLDTSSSLTPGVMKIGNSWQPATIKANVSFWASRLTRRSAQYSPLSRPPRRTGNLRRIVRLAVLSWTFITTLGWLLILLFAVFLPSYTIPPAHYDVMRERIQGHPTTGIANVHREKVFIAASLYDQEGALTSGDWADSVLRLISILGPGNVHLSLYENDADAKSKASLEEFKKRLHCNTTIVDEKMDYEALPHITMPDGTRRLKRLEFLAEVRNRALAPLAQSKTRFDKLLFLNDIVFDPIDAANLLFSTNRDESGKANYRAACAVDFKNPFKFYDTFATRDTGGFDMGVIFYPWFTSAGDSTSRNDVLAQKDAVRVKSCWGGMVAFEAKWFQREYNKGATTKHVKLPLRFRAEKDTFWDASECCLVHADLAALTSDIDDEPGIFMNPYIRVAYSKQVLDWLWISRRPERLYAPVQAVVNWLAGRPSFNPRRSQNPGDRVVDKVWVSNDGGLSGDWNDVSRIAKPGAFCGFRDLQYLVIHPETGEKHWKEEKIPPGG